jgi:hypothetical protein
MSRDNHRRGVNEFEFKKKPPACYWCNSRGGCLLATFTRDVLAICRFARSNRLHCPSEARPTKTFLIDQSPYVTCGIGIRAMRIAQTLQFPTRLTVNIITLELSHIDTVATNTLIFYVVHNDLTARVWRRVAILHRRLLPETR